MASDVFKDKIESIKTSNLEKAFYCVVENKIDNLFRYFVESSIKEYITDRDDIIPIYFNTHMDMLFKTQKMHINLLYFLTTVFLRLKHKFNNEELYNLLLLFIVPYNDITIDITKINKEVLKIMYRFMFVYKTNKQCKIDAFKNYVSLDTLQIIKSVTMCIDTLDKQSKHLSHDKLQSHFLLNMLFVIKIASLVLIHKNNIDSSYRNNLYTEIAVFYNKIKNNI